MEPKEAFGPCPWCWIKPQFYVLVPEILCQVIAVPSHSSREQWHPYAYTESLLRFSTCRNTHFMWMSFMDPRISNSTTLLHKVWVVHGMQMSGIGWKIGTMLVNCSQRNCSDGMMHQMGVAPGADQNLYSGVSNSSECCCAPAPLAHFPEVSTWPLWEQDADLHGGIGLIQQGLPYVLIQYFVWVF